MRLSTIIISSAFVLAGMSAALSTERENMLLARFSDSDLLGEVEARAYDELYARGILPSKPRLEDVLGEYEHRKEYLKNVRPPSPPSRNRVAYKSDGKSRPASEQSRDYERSDVFYKPNIL